MSKTTDKYDELKKENSEILYAFKQGGFYIFIEKDMEIVSKILNLNSIDFGKDSKGNKVQKCGFPIKTKEDKFKILTDNGLKYKIIELESKADKKMCKAEFNEMEKIIDEIRNIDLMTISEREAFVKICDFKSRLKR